MSPGKTIARLGRYLAVLASVTSVARPSAAAGTCRAIESIPARITAPGRHCLTADTRSDVEQGAAITIMADWVTVDLQGFRLTGTTPDATAVEAVNQRGVTIRGGAISGFGHGIRLSGRQGGYHLVEGVSLEEISGVVLRVDGCHNLVRRNQIAASPPAAGSHDARGIVVRGPLSRVLLNELTSVAAGPAVEVSQADGAVIEGNVVIGAGAAEATGVRVASGSDVLVIRNELRDLSRGVVFTQGAGLYQGNLTTGVPEPYVGGTDGDRER